LAVVVAAVLFGVCSAQSQQYHPQPNVLTGLNHQAVGATSSSPSSPAHALPFFFFFIFRSPRNQFSNALRFTSIFIFHIFFDV
jgi:hypothetical protein